MFLEWDSQIGLSDVFGFVGLLLTIISLVFAGYQFRKSAKAQKASFLLDIIEKFFSDESLIRIRYRLDHNKIIAEDFLREIGVENNKDEAALDKLLYLIDTIGSLVNNKVIGIKEVEFMEYQIRTIMEHPVVKEYLNRLDPTYTQFLGRSAHLEARELAKQLKKKRR